MEASRNDVVTSVWRTLWLVFGLVPVAAGADKFFDVLVYWPKYIAPLFTGMIPMSPQGFMHLVGVIEIVAGLGVLLSPWKAAFGYIVAAWLTCIAVNLIAGRYFDIAVRDLAMALSAVSFARLTAVVPESASLRRRHMQTAGAAT